MLINLCGLMSVTQTEEGTSRRMQKVFRLPQLRDSPYYVTSMNAVLETNSCILIFE